MPKPSTQKGPKPVAAAKSAGRTSGKAAAAEQPANETRPDQGTAPSSVPLARLAVGAPKAEAGSDAAKAAEADGAAKPAATGQLRLRDLLERITASSGLRGKELRPVVEAALAELGKALDAGEVVNLPALGKLRLVRKTQSPTGPIMVLKLRRDSAEDRAAATESRDRKKQRIDPLAEADEADY